MKKRLLKLMPLIGVVAIWRLAVSLVCLFAINNLPYLPTFPYAKELLSPYGPRLLTTWAQFDGVHYLTIILSGYKDTELIQAFFPLYPLIIKYLHFLPLNTITLGITLSTVCLTASLMMLRPLLQRILPQVSANKIMLLILLFPTSFFFTSFYTESLFLFLLLVSFYAMEKKSFALAGIFGALASATRLTGLFIMPTLVWVWWVHHKKDGLKSLTKPRSIINFLWCCLPLLGIGTYMLYLYREFGDPLLFVHVQDEFGALRETDKVILLYQVFFRYFKMLITVYPLSHTYFVVVLELAAGILGLVGSIMVYRHLPRQYTIYTVLSYVTPTLTGTFSSLPRYLLTIIPIFFVLGAKLSSRAFTIWLIASAILLAAAVAVFTTGNWVA